jgi:molybdopterin-containing oxidoreductase family iron-sulfur binding subunit
MAIRKKLDRRSFLAAAAGAACGLFGLAGCSRDAWESFLQPHFKNLTVEELEGVLDRLRREFKSRYGREFTIRADPPIPGLLFGYGLDLSRCVGCRRCVHACEQENNLSRDPQVHWIRVLEMEEVKGIDLAESSAYYCAPLHEEAVEPGKETQLALEIHESRDGLNLSRDVEKYALSDEERLILKDQSLQYPLYKKEFSGPGTVPRPDFFYMPVACQQCSNPPCVKVCPVKATWQEKDGIVVVDYNWCIGCRCCMAACPYGARHFNWGEPVIPPDEMNTETHYLGNRPRYKGHVDKCTFFIQRVRRGRYPACVEICPVGARKFGDLNDPNGEMSYLLHNKRTFIFKPELNTGPKFFYFYGP